MTTLLRSLRLAILVAASSLFGADFSKTLTPEEFAAAGLSKLTDAERAQLDALIQRQQSAEANRVRVETTAHVKAEASAAAPAANSSLLHRMKVVLTPGADIAYEKVETELVGAFKGYEPGTILTLANGQQWKVVDGTWFPTRKIDRPRKVVIAPGVLGSFFLEIEDGGRPKVKIVRTGN